MQKGVYLSYTPFILFNKLHLLWKLICIDQIPVAGFLPDSAKQQITGTNCRLSSLFMSAGDLRARTLPGIGSRTYALQIPAC